MNKKEFENIALDKKMDRVEAKKEGISVKKFEGSKQDNKEDAKAMKQLNDGMVKKTGKTGGIGDRNGHGGAKGKTGGIGDLNGKMKKGKKGRAHPVQKM